jgi:hypothetical protein
MLASLIAGVLLGQQPQSVTKVYDLPAAPRLRVSSNMSPLASPKLSTKEFDKQRWEFDWLVACYGTLDPEASQLALKFRIFSQERLDEGDRAEMAGRMLMRLWEMTVRRTGLDHKPDLNRGIIDVYLCWGGQAGGEQFLAVDDEGGQRRLVSNIYIYQIQTFTDPVEMAREVAHEYGHAVLPPIGGYTQPEAWGNGLFGEKLFLSWMVREMSIGRVKPAEAMGATVEQLNAWVVKNADPFLIRAATEGPVEATLAGKSQAAMESYAGLGLYAQAILPRSVFIRSLKLTGSQNAKDYPNAIVLAAKEPEAMQIVVPSMLKGKAIWVPVGKGQVLGAEVLQRRGDWAKIMPEGPQFTLQAK